MDVPVRQRNLPVLSLWQLVRDFHLPALTLSQQALTNPDRARGGLPYKVMEQLYPQGQEKSQFLEMSSVLPVHWEAQAADSVAPLVLP